MTEAARAVVASAWSTADDWPVPTSASYGRVVESLVDEFGDQFRDLAPLWLRTDPNCALWTVAPLAVLIVAAPQSLLRPFLALFVAAGIGLSLQWQSAREAQNRRVGEFVNWVAQRVASRMFNELSPHLLEEACRGYYRPELCEPILAVAEHEADRQRAQ